MAAHAELIIVPLVGAFIGWVTNFIAIRMLFRPRRPWRIPLLAVTLQGAIPRRQKELARSLGAAVERDLLSMDDLTERFLGPETQRQLADGVASRVVRRLEESLRFVPPPLREPVLRYAEETTRREALALMQQSIGPFKAELRDRVQLAQMVEERLLAFSLDELERLVVGLTARELRDIEILGGVLGFLVGVVQVLVTTLLRAQ